MSIIRNVLAVVSVWFVLGSVEGWGQEVTQKSATPTTSPAKNVVATPSQGPQAVPMSRPAAPLATYPASPHAEIICAEPIHDFGSHGVIPQLKHTFVIANRGTATLEISKVHPGCGCTAAGNYPPKIEPGQTGEFPFKLNGTSLHGYYSKPITVYSNDPVTPRLILTLKGQCKRPIEIMPTSVYFDSATGNAVQERILKVTNNTDNPAEVTINDTLPYDKQHFKAELIETQPGKEWNLKITTVPPYVSGTYSTNIKLKTTVQDSEVLETSVTLRVPQRVEVLPRNIQIPVPIPGQENRPPTPQWIQVRNCGETPVKVIGATVGDERVKAEIIENQSGKWYQVKVTFPENYELPSQGASVTITTDDSQFSKLSVPIIRPYVNPRPPTSRPTSRPAPQSLKMLKREAPSFKLTSFGGKEVTPRYADGAGITVLNFVAVNCGFCQRQIPLVESVRKDYEAKGVRFVNIIEKMRQEFDDEQVKNVLSNLGSKMEIARDPNNAIGIQYKATGLPSQFIVGKTGIIERVNPGAALDLAETMRKQLDELLKVKSAESSSSI